MNAKHTSRYLLIAAVLAFFVSGELRADTLVFYQARETNVGGSAVAVLFPAALAVSGSKPAQLVPAVYDALYEWRPTLYDGSSFAVRGGFVDVQLADAAWAARDIVLSEVYHSLRAAGVEDIRISRLKAEPMVEADAPLAVFLPIYPLWQVLPPRTVRHTLVKLGKEELLSSDRVAVLLDQSDAKVMDRLRSLLNDGSEAAQLAVIEFFEHKKLSSREGDYARALKPSHPSAVKLRLLEALESTRNERTLDAIANVADNDMDPMVKSAAARILMDRGRAKYRAYILLEKLQSPRVDTVVAAIGDIVKSGNRSLATSLGALLAHEDERVRETALAGIVGLKDLALVARAMDNEGVAKALRLVAAGHLTQSSNASLVRRGLRFQLLHGEADVATSAAKMIGELKARDAQSELTAALKRDEPEVRHAAARAFGAMKMSTALPALAEAVENPADKEVVEPVVISIIASMPLGSVIELTESEIVVLRRLSLKSLAEFSKERVSTRILKVLRARLSDTDPEIRKAAVYALARTPDRDVARDLLSLQDDADAFVREQVVVAVVAAGLPEAKDLVLAKLKDTSDGVKYEAVKGVRKLKIVEAKPRLLWMVDYRKIEIKREVVQAVVDLATPADYDKHFDIYVRLMFDMDETVKLAALEGLRPIPDPRVVSHISSLVRDPNETIQLAAIRALGESGDPRSVEALAGALLVGSHDVKLAVLTALAQLRAEQARKPLDEFLLNETDLGLKKKALEVLDLLP